MGEPVGAACSQPASSLSGAASLGPRRAQPRWGRGGQGGHVSLIPALRASAVRRFTIALQQTTM
jgi:hypothetical protein